MQRINVTIVASESSATTVKQNLQLKGRMKMGNKSRERMTGFTVQGRLERANKRKEEEEAAMRRAHRAMIRGLAAAMKKE